MVILDVIGIYFQLSMSPKNRWLIMVVPLYRIYFLYIPMRAISFFGATVCSLPLESSHVAPLKRAEACPKSFHVACGWLKRGYCD